MPRAAPCATANLHLRPMLSILHTLRCCRFVPYGSHPMHPWGDVMRECHKVCLLECAGSSDDASWTTGRCCRTHADPRRTLAVHAPISSVLPAPRRWAYRVEGVVLETSVRCRPDAPAVWSQSCDSSSRTGQGSATDSVVSLRERRGARWSFQA